MLPLFKKGRFLKEFGLIVHPNLLLSFPCDLPARTRSQRFYNALVRIPKRKELLWSTRTHGSHTTSRS